MELGDLMTLTDGQLAAIMRNSGEGSASEAAFGAFWLRYERQVDIAILGFGGIQRGSSFCGNVRDRVCDKLRKYATGTDTESIKSYVNRAIRTCYIDEIRWANVRAAVPFSAALEPEHDNHLDADDASPRIAETHFADEDAFVAAARARETASMAESNQASQALYGALETLALEGLNGQRMAEVLQMTHVDGMTQEAIAEHFGKTDRTVRRWYVDGMARMREILRDRFGIVELEQLV